MMPPELIKNPKKILIVDDDKLLQAYLMSLFEAQNYISDQLFSGDGLEHYFKTLKRMPDLILLDVLMPGKDGFYWLEWLTAHYPMIPVIMLTVESKQQDCIFALSSGAVDYINKPFDIKELLLRVQIMMRLHSTDATGSCHKFYFGSYWYDFDSKTLQNQKGNLHLTENEKSLFDTLCKHYGKTVSREQLSVEIGVEDYHPMDRRIDVHISHLRNKLENLVGKSKYIHSVRNSGYFLKYDE
ncbi:MAG: response regulator transcription factor [Cocleimonas sp.]|nr:response regulator transcription factor [Cocleimonas sp.]